MANETILEANVSLEEQTRKQIRDACQGAIDQKPNGQSTPNAIVPGDFSISNGLMQGPGAPPKNLSGSYLS